MEWVETTGQTVREALDAALDELGVDEQDAEVIVLEEPRSSLFGLRKTTARVRARVTPSAPRPKRQQRPRRSRAEPGPGPSAPAEPGPRPPSGARREASGGRGGRADAPAGRRSTARAAPQGAGADGGEEEPPTEAGRRGRRRGGSRARVAAEAASSPARSQVDKEGQMSIESQATAAAAFVRGVVEQFGARADTEVTTDEDHILVTVTGGDLGLLVGPRGATLDALQELTRTAVQRRGEEHTTRLVVDVAGYRAKRTAALEAFVRRVAAEVLETGEAQALEPMSPADRKLVHDTASTVAGVTTTSEGTEPNRYVVIRPGSASPLAPTASASPTADEPEPDDE